MRDDDPEREPLDWLLKLDAAVHRDQDIVVAAHPAQEIAILDAGSAASDHGINVVAGELQGEIYGQLLVKKDAHRPGASRGPGRVRRWPVRASRKEIGGETRLGIATFQMIEERLHRDPRANKDRGATEDVWIAMDDLVQLHHGDLLMASLEVLFP